MLQIKNNPSKVKMLARRVEQISIIQLCKQSNNKTCFECSALFTEIFEEFEQTLPTLATYLPLTVCFYVKRRFFLSCISAKVKGGYELDNKTCSPMYFTHSPEKRSLRFP